MIADITEIFPRRLRQNRINMSHLQDYEALLSLRSVTSGSLNPMKISPVAPPHRLSETAAVFDHYRFNYNRMIGSWLANH
ncbi:MAG TPA: hypothetical protein VGL35_05270 [Rhizomicrobium sp.]|jgi:hypothetical protein